MRSQNLGLRFKEMASKNSNKIALYLGSNTFSFEVLNSRSEQCAEYLRSFGVIRKDVVLIAGEKEDWAYIAILACLKIGATYSLIDPETPHQRLNSIISSCQPKLIILNEQLKETLLKVDKLGPVRTLEANQMLSKASQFPPAPAEISWNVLGSDPAYIMFTSGSTGVPKGAIITHDNVLNFIDWVSKEFKVSSDDIFTNVNALYFDNSVFDFYGSLFNGAGLAGFNRKLIMSPLKLVNEIDRIGCSIWFSVPTLLIYLSTTRALSKQSFSKLRKIVFGGEGYPKAKLKQLFSLFSERISFINVYGPTECTCICSAYEISADDFNAMEGFPPVGQLIKNFDYLIVDSDLKSVPEGETGELLLIGPNVGRGYFADPKRTAAGFIQNPTNKNYEERVYRTGDLFSYDRPTGKLLIHGRVDNQIKHQGYRIETEEIELALCKISAIKQAVAFQVVDRGIDKIAAVVSSDTLSAKDELQTKEQLAHYLPPYMIPAMIFFRDELKTNANGKVNRKEIAEEHRQLMEEK